MQAQAASRLLPVIFVLVACASTPPPKPDTTPTGAAEMQGVQRSSVTTETGSIATESYSATATVSAIDRSTRQVTLQRNDGSKVSFIAGPEVRNFDQINLGDHVTAAIDTELVVSVRKSGPPVEETVVTAQGRARQGEKPGAAVITSVQGVAKIVGLDPAHRQATLRFSDGSTKTYPVRPGIDLTKVSVGDEVVFRATEAHSIIVTNP
jgi:Cu/Ag efflux protein CusF